MIDVGKAPAELRAVAAVLASIEPELRRQVNTHVRTALNAVWKPEVDRRARTELDRRIIGAGVRVKAGNPPAALAAQSRRGLSGGATPVDDWPAWEFGGNREKVSTYSMRTKAGSRRVRRHASRQIPSRIRAGRVAFPALKATAPRMVSVMAATVVRTVLDEVEKRTG